MRVIVGETRREANVDVAGRLSLDALVETLLVANLQRYVLHQNEDNNIIIYTDVIFLFSREECVMYGIVRYLSVCAVQKILVIPTLKWSD